MASFRNATILLAAALAAAVPAWAADPVTAYPAMAPVDQYRIAKSADEIALARTAAPPSISADATIMVLGTGGYDTAVAGKNGFVCMVLRSWTANFDDPVFWNPKVRGPVCYNPAAVRSVLPEVIERTQWVLAGVSKSQMEARAKTSAAATRLPDPGAFGFMMSKDGYLSDAGTHRWHPHLMFYQAHAKAADWGADLPGSPVVSAEGEPVTMYFVPLAKWSDGSSAVDMH
jgi:hypothetical protein